ncbi:MAG: hypothetical protein JWM02_1272 [Frankiales bacterium]|nr:hypothetical protein [Frankiales bacterium]
MSGSSRGAGNHVLLLRAVNVGPHNRLAMKDLSNLLVDLGHGDVKTYLNSGNATFSSSRRSTQKLATEVEDGLRERLGLDVRACVRKAADIQNALEELPDLDGYIVVNVLFDRPAPEALKRCLDTDWSPETVLGNDQVLYLAYSPAGLHSGKVTNAKLEKLLGVGCTARTPATLRKLLT